MPRASFCTPGDLPSHIFAILSIWSKRPYPFADIYLLGAGITIHTKINRRAIAFLAIPGGPLAIAERSYLQDVCPTLEEIWSGDSPWHLHLCVDFRLIIAEELIIRCSIISSCPLPWAPRVTLKNKSVGVGHNCAFILPFYLSGAACLYRFVPIQAGSNEFTCDYC